MEVRDMERRAWTRLTAKKQIIRDFACGDRRGKISLMKILAVSEPFRRRVDGRDTVLAGPGCWWLQLALHGSRAWYTVMFDPSGRFIQAYVDVTDGNDALRDDPVFTDMYLDYVLSGEGVAELDRDELDEAFARGRITKEQYDSALDEGRRIYALLSENGQKAREFFREQFERLKKELGE